MLLFLWKDDAAHIGNVDVVVYNHVDSTITIGVLQGFSFLEVGNYLTGSITNCIDVIVDIYSILTSTSKTDIPLLLKMFKGPINEPLYDLVFHMFSLLKIRLYDSGDQIYSDGLK